MRNKYIFVTLLLLFMALAGYGFTSVYGELDRAEEGEELVIVTSFYPMYVATTNIVGDTQGVTVKNLSEPQTGCLHDYQLTPQDMKLLSQADVFVVNGGGMEGFLTTVAEKYPQLTILYATEEIQEEVAHEQTSHEEEHLDEIELHEEESHEGHSHGANAHFWMSIAHYKEQVHNIGEALKQIDASHAEEFENGMKEYLQKIEELQEEAQALKEELNGTEVILLHEAFEFLAEDLGLVIAGRINLDEEHQVSAGEVADLLEIMEEHDVTLLLAEEFYGKEIGDTLEQEADCKVSYLDTLVQEESSNDSWLKGMKQNLAILRSAIESEKLPEEK